MGLEPLSKPNVYFAMSVCASRIGGTQNNVRRLLPLGCPGFFRDDDGARIAVFVGSNLYDLDGNFLGRLDGCTRSLPIALTTALRKLLEGATAVFSPYSLSLPRRVWRLP
jgi:hypothetical protein